MPFSRLLKLKTRFCWANTGSCCQAQTLAPMQASISSVLTLKELSAGVFLELTLSLAETEKQKSCFPSRQLGGGVFPSPGRSKIISAIVIDFPPFHPRMLRSHNLKIRARTWLAFIRTAAAENACGIAPSASLTHFLSIFAMAERLMHSNQEIYLSEEVST